MGVWANTKKKSSTALSLKKKIVQNKNGKQTLPSVDHLLSNGPSLTKQNYFILYYQIHSLFIRQTQWKFIAMTEFVNLQEIHPNLHTTLPWIFYEK